jgi:hypothetical protein
MYSLIPVVWVFSILLNLNRGGYVYAIKYDIIADPIRYTIHCWRSAISRLRIIHSGSSPQVARLFSRHLGLFSFLSIQFISSGSNMYYQ